MLPVPTACHLAFPMLARPGPGPGALSTALPGHPGYSLPLFVLLLTPFSSRFSSVLLLCPQGPAFRFPHSGGPRPTLPTACQCLQGLHDLTTSAQPPEAPTAHQHSSYLDSRLTACPSEPRKAGGRFPSRSWVCSLSACTGMQAAPRSQPQRVCALFSAGSLSENQMP